jgi:hypothetical protein
VQVDQFEVEPPALGVGGQELVEPIAVRIRQVAVAQGGNEAFDFAAQVRAHGGHLGKGAI